MLTNQEIYLSTDVETNGPIPGPYSMLSFASVGYQFINDKLIEIGNFTANVITLPDAKEDPDTMEWWSKNKEAYNITRENLIRPDIAMHDYVKWIESLPGKPVFVGYPAGFDFLFVYWYLIYFVGRSPFSFSALDIKTLAMGILKRPYRECIKKNFPKHWFGKLPHTHNALDDAREQGEMFCNMLVRLMEGDK